MPLDPGVPALRVCGAEYFEVGSAVEKTGGPYHSAVAGIPDVHGDPFRVGHGQVLLQELYSGDVFA